MRSERKKSVDNRLFAQEPIFVTGEPAEKSFYPRKEKTKHRPDDTKDSEEPAEKSFHPVKTILK